MPDKPLIWLGSSRRDLRAFPALARRLAGFQRTRSTDRPPTGSCSRELRQQHGKEKHSLGSRLPRANVFRDLGFSKEESEHLLVRADLADSGAEGDYVETAQAAEAAKVLRVTQPRVSDLLPRSHRLV